MGRLGILIILAFASSLSTLAMDFFAPSLPAATRSLNATPQALKASMMLFLVGYGIGPFFWGPLADRAGRRRVITIGIGCYIVASLACLLAPGITAFSAARLLQGMSAAAGAVVARAVLRDIHGASGATQAIARMFLIMVWVPITAPLIGGLLSSWFDWRVSFVVMASVAGATLLAAFLWLAETNPARADGSARPRTPWRQVLTNPAFLRHALPNMFCFATLLLFLSNYSYVTEALYGFTARENGWVLTGFNSLVSAGFYLVLPFVPRFGIETSIRAGLWMSLIGWVILWLIALLPEPAFAPMLPCLLLACLGTGMVASLTAGQALIPFTYAAGTASALFILVQSSGAAAVNFLAGQWLDLSLDKLAFVLALCALLGLAGSRLPGSGD